MRRSRFLSPPSRACLDPRLDVNGNPSFIGCPFGTGLPRHPGQKPFTERSRLPSSSQQPLEGKQNTNSENDQGSPDIKITHFPSWDICQNQDITTPNAIFKRKYLGV